MDTHERSPIPLPPYGKTPRGSAFLQWSLASIVGAIAASFFAARALAAGGLDHSAALYIGIPALLAIGLSLMPTGKSATGGILKGMCIALLLSAPILGEGFI